uniref:TsaA-like domain-containing protein n=1 Tax=Rhizophora mucronata TaxID=61149 RepID=A0A2P2Q4K0_RHIMU
MGFDVQSKWLTPMVALAFASLSASTAISLYFCRKKSKELESKVQELQISLNSSAQKCSAERQGRIRAQQALRKALAQSQSENLEQSPYPMTPIGVIQSCFSTRNGTPRQPLLVPLARACLFFDSARVPPASLEGLAEYTHCWIIYVFHLNTDLEKLWRQPSRSKFKAKVRVPRLKGGRMGVFATRSPHRPCPIGLTVAKMEAVRRNMILLSGVDLVDGTPVLDIKPYLPYCDSIQGAAMPEWVTMDNMLAVTSVSFSEGFSSSIADCWETVEKKSLYGSWNEFQCLIRQVLSWDIRSVSQRNQTLDSLTTIGNGGALEGTLGQNSQDKDICCNENDMKPLCSEDAIYHLILEGIDISYRMNCNGNVVVEKAVVSSGIPSSNRNRCNYSFWGEELN